MPEVGIVSDHTWPAHQAPRRSPVSPATKAFDFGHAYDPGRSDAPARSHRSFHPHRHSRALAGLTVVLASVIGAYFADRYGPFDRDRLATLFGFGIEQVSLTGHRFTPDAELFNALDLSTAHSLASFDASATRMRFERLPWVQSVEISRVWPGQLAIRIKERRPFAIWERADGSELIDVTGRSLGPVKRDAVIDLPRVAGEGASPQAAKLLAVIDQYPVIKSRLVRATRLAGRRWTLEVTGGGRIHLPADGEATALARLTADPRVIALLKVPGQIIDLRSPTKIAVRAPAGSIGAGG